MRSLRLAWRQQVRSARLPKYPDHPEDNCMHHHGRTATASKLPRTKAAPPDLRQSHAFFIFSHF